MVRSVIPFNRASLSGRELDYIRTAIDNGHISGDGPFTRRCEALLQHELGVARVLLTTSCTHALEMAAMLLQIGPGDEVIVPSFTYASTVNAFVLRGATPVFVDIRRDSLNLDETRLEALITPRTKAIVLVHYGGIACDMDAISMVASERRIPIVEDNAHGLFGTYRGKPLGSFGSLGALSFHETKNFTCGEGGALLINEPRLTDRAEVLREKGTNRSRFFRGEIDRYTWVDLGSSYGPSDLLAAFLLAQLECRHEIQAARKRLWFQYERGLKDWAAKQRIGLPWIPPHCEPSYHLFYLRLPSLSQRERFIRTLQEWGIHCVFHYPPLHTSPMGQRFGYGVGDCPVTERVSDELVRLPFFISLTGSEQQAIIEVARSFRVGHGKGARKQTPRRAGPVSLVRQAGSNGQRRAG